ncbi:hypothetical protein [Sneathiella litorea]|uniref:Cytochrome c domain-containing protein n=1 Tax=Sneathiella litorea TaxID=2606216 RepID=A0A6L8W4T3_9PROT|nr:hypothetical protein [Sneathiella litorea]MZR29237.1 hypothetical protein [Sneathiella litorea]
MIYISLLFASAAVVTSAAADEGNWLPPGSSTEMLKGPPLEFIRPETVRNEDWLYGRLLFHSPSLLGEKAVRIGLSCNSCHPNGHANTDFFITGLSDRPGQVDVTHHFWKAGFDDGIFNPVNIPSLRGSRDTAPYGTINVLPDLHAFTRHVIEVEFAGPSPSSEKLEALVVYLNSIDNKELGNNQSFVKTSSNMSYLPLLRAPLQNRDYARLRELTDLIRSDFGRRANLPEAQVDRIKSTVAILRTLIVKADEGDYTAAFTIYEDLMANQ